jgi:hypothetical protein
MLCRFSHFFACLLLVLITLQGFAAANMSVCNSMMQAQSNAPKSANMPCHMANTHKNSTHMASMTKTQDSCKHNLACKTNCATLCASLSSVTALNQATPIMPVMAASQVIIAYNKTYTSYYPPSLQRPPNFLS